MVKKLLILLLLALGIAAVVGAVRLRPKKAQPTMPTKTPVPTKPGSPDDPGYVPPAEPVPPTTPVEPAHRSA